MSTGFEDLLNNFNLSEKRRIKLTGKSKISSIQGFVSSVDPHQIHRIHGWISKIHRLNKKKLDISFSFIDGSGELANLKMSSSRNEFPIDDLNPVLFEFGCLDIKIVQAMPRKDQITKMMIPEAWQRKELDLNPNSSMSKLVKRRIPLISNDSSKMMYNNKCSHWLWILNVKEDQKTISESSVPTKVLDQVQLDVERAFCFDSGLSKSNISERREKLYRIIKAVLSRNPSFKYYQGFHEICSVFTIVFECSEEKCIIAIESFASNCLKDFFTESFDNILRQHTERTLSIVSEYTIEYDKVRRCQNSEKERFNQMISKVKELVEPHGLIASWFLTWFVHEFPDFKDSLKIFDLQLTELKRSRSLSPICVAAALMMIYRDRMVDWRDDPFELIMFIRNIPKIAQVREVIKYARIIHEPIPPVEMDNRQPIIFGNRFWTAIIVLHFIYYMLSMTIFPGLKYL